MNCTFESLLLRLYAVILSVEVTNLKQWSTLVYNVLLFASRNITVTCLVQNQIGQSPPVLGSVVLQIKQWVVES